MPSSSSASPPLPPAAHGAWPALLLAALLAATVPTLLALHQPPSATLLNQCVAVALWGTLVAVMAPRLAAGLRPAAALMAALLLVALAAAGSWWWGTLPRSLALQAIGLIAGAALMAGAGAAAARSGQGVAVFIALAWGLLAAGLLNAGVALVQVFAPAWADGSWIAAPSLPGRAVGNLRQPNHLCSLLLWALAAAVGLHALGRLPGRLLALVLPLLVLGVELSASRTGAAGLLLFVAWGLVDRRLPRSARLALLAMPLLYGLAWGAMAWWGSISQQAVGAAARLATDGGLETSSPNARSNIWRNALQLIAANPWTGTGFGEFNLAWSMTHFANRPTAFFDHTHNLPLQLMVELGLPLALGVMALLGVALWQGWRRGVAAADHRRALAGRTALVLVLLTGLHSLVEYPLWYAYFLLPAALAWGLLLGQPGDAGRGTPSEASPPVDGAVGGLVGGTLAGLLLAAGGALAVLDYQRVVVIYAPPDDGGTLAGRIAVGQLSPLFAHQADYAAATNQVPPASRALGLARATHALLDTRLMMAWAHGLAANGHLDEARWVAARLRDFRNADADDFFAPCIDRVSASASPPFQCQAPQRGHDWRHLARLPALRALPP